MDDNNDEVIDEPGGEREEVVLEVPEVARRLRISRSFVYELIKTGQLSAMRLGRRVLVPTKMLDDFIARGGRHP